MEKQLFIGVDIGGTFTDVVLAERHNQHTHNVKTLTTPDQPVQGVMNGIRQALSETGNRPEQVQRIVHATTLPTNLVLERKGAKVAFITTAGFGDMLRISKQYPAGDDRFNVFYQRLPPLIQEDMTLEISERLDHRGDVIEPLDLQQAEADIRALADQGPDAVAICLLHAYANPDHERRLCTLVETYIPGAYVSLSSSVWPEYGEYERASTTVLSAYIGPTFSRYIRALHSILQAAGITADLQIMQSNGAVMDALQAADKAAYVIESGPAAGVMAAADLGRLAGQPDLIAFDMGGTTAKAGLVRAGEPRITHDFHVGGSASANAQGAGEPLKVPVIDLAEVGAGGGSIAWVDAGNFMQLGPHSASSNPGPACYGLGGDKPTVTDANVVLGYINPEYFNGGTMTIHPEQSRAAIKHHIADKLGINVAEAAAGIHDLANVLMGSAIRIVTLQRGIDPREFAIVASGGAGPIHVVRIAEQFAIPTTIVPLSPGVKSAFGLLVSDLAHDYVNTAIMPVDCPDIERLTERFKHMENTAQQALSKQRKQGATLQINRYIDIRFTQQHNAQSIPIAAGAITPQTVAIAEKTFREQYRETFGIDPLDSCEIVNLRLRVVVVVDKPRPSPQPISKTDAKEAIKGTRLAYFAETNGFTETPIYDRLLLTCGNHLTGPCIIEEPDSATVCPPGYNITVDAYFNLLIHKRRV